VLLGFGWDETGWPEQRPPTRDELDRASGGRLVLLSRVDVHSAVVSSGLLDAVPDVAHAEGYDGSGLVARDAHHAARAGLFRLTPAADREDAILRALQDAAAQGIGMVHELGAPHICPPQDFAILDDLGSRGWLPEVVRYWGGLDVAEARALGCEGAAGDLCMDGSIGSRTSALHAPYTDATTSGHLYLDAGQVAEHVVGCTRAGLQAGFHVIGDRAVAEVVAGLEAAADEIGVPAIVSGRHRLEHVEMATPEQMAVLGRLGVTASMQPMFDALWGGDDALYAQRLGPERARPMNALASMDKAGVALAFGSDTPVTPFAPWAGVRAAAWHRTESERITVRAAFDAHTRGGWHAARRDEGGVIALGAPASIAVWDVPGDLVAQAGVPRLPDLRPDTDLPTCVLTLVRGEVAYEQPGAWS
jgi:predicted amidohydrolase YtcJ